MPKSKSANPLEDLFSETLKDVFFAEKQILRALPKMAKESATPQLKEAFETHRDETEQQVERLNQIFEAMGRPARGKTCEAILGHHRRGQGVHGRVQGNRRPRSGADRLGTDRRAL